MLRWIPPPRFSARTLSRCPKLESFFDRESINRNPTSLNKNNVSKERNTTQKRTKRRRIKDERTERRFKNGGRSLFLPLHSLKFWRKRRFPSCSKLRIKTYINVLPRFPTWILLLCRSANYRGISRIRLQSWNTRQDNAPTEFSRVIRYNLSFLSRNEKKKKKGRRGTLTNSVFPDATAPKRFPLLSFPLITRSSVLFRCHGE